MRWLARRFLWVSICTLAAPVRLAFLAALALLLAFRTTRVRVSLCPAQQAVLGPRLRPGAAAQLDTWGPSCPLTLHLTTLGPVRLLPVPATVLVPASPSALAVHAMLAIAALSRLQWARRILREAALQ